MKKVGVYELGRNGPRTVLAPTPGITDLDVADSIVTAGLTRRGYPPRAVSAVELAAAVGGGLLLAAWGVWVWRRRRALPIVEPDGGGQGDAGVPSTRSRAIPPSG